MQKLSPISIFGTNSDSGKSTLTFIIGSILQDFGLSVAPFKAQNYSNNARVADDGSEIAYSQYFQALVLNQKTSWHNNPILLKSGGSRKTSVILRGKALKSSDIKGYYRDLNLLKPAVKEGFEYLQKNYDVVVAEGAGSPVELNLMDKDLSNIFVAEEFESKIILVADIEKGGVFASIYGVINLLPPRLKSRVVGVVINKFRGDLSLFDEGRRIIEKQFGVPLLGVLPYYPLNLGFEDSLSLINYNQAQKSPSAKRVAVIAYPTMSNYNDFEPLILDNSTLVEFIRSDTPLNSFDLVILPGSKLVMRDLDWLKRSGLFNRLKSRNCDILGICGGYEMMFERLIDTNGVESEQKSAEGLGFVDDEVFFQEKKILKKGNYKIFGRDIEGFEIHNGVSQKYPLFFEDKSRDIRGTFIHGIFEDFRFRLLQKSEILKFLKEMKSHLNIKKIEREIFG
jgi:adenosylcobyric acid synthase